MKWLIPVLLLLNIGCSLSRECLREVADEVNQAAFGGKVQYSIDYCNRQADVTCWKHHGLFNPVGNRIHIAPEWYWEPRIYFTGVIAHELIHAYLYQTRQESNEPHPHSWRFRQERERVAKVLDIPEWSIPDGKKSGDKLDASRMMASLERYQKAKSDRVHGVISSHVEAPGWPTELYDPEDWREEPPPEKK